MGDAIKREQKELDVKKQIYRILIGLEDDESRRRVMLAVAILSGVELEELP